jgi:chromate transporter
LAAFVAFSPSFVFVLAGGPRFDRLRSNTSIQAFLTGAGAAAIGAIAGASISLGRALGEPWQIPLLAAAAVWLVALRRNVVIALLSAGAIGTIAVLAGAAVAR